MGIIKKHEFGMNQFEATGVVTTDVEVTPCWSAGNRPSHKATFGFRIADNTAASIPLIAFGDMAMKLQALVSKGCKVNLWCSAMDYHGELKFCIQKCVLFAYPEDGEENG